MRKAQGTKKEIISNKKNQRFYEIQDQYECGLLLNSPTVKKILNYQLSLNGSHGWVKNGEIWLRGLTDSNIKLLLNKSEIAKIIRYVKEKKFLLIPSNIYLKNHRLKINLTVAKRNNLKNKEKIETIRKKDLKKLSRDWEY